MQKKILIDVGNSSVKVCLSTDEKLLESFNLSSNVKQSSDTYGLQILGLLNHLNIPKNEISACYIASVVPQINDILSNALQRFISCPIYFCPEDIAIPLVNKYGNPSEVGADRLVASYAARVLYPEPISLISIDYGTATTFDCVSDNNYLGGLIAPGLLSSRDSLARLTARLPRTNLNISSGNKAIIGQDTVTSINHGFLFGFVAMSEGLIQRLKSELPAPCQVIASGGFVQSLAKHTNHFNHINPNLILEGLRLLSNMPNL